MARRAGQARCRGSDDGRGRQPLPLHGIRVHSARRRAAGQGVRRSAARGGGARRGPRGTRRPARVDARVRGRGGTAPAGPAPVGARPCRRAAARHRAWRRHRFLRPDARSGERFPAPPSPLSTGLFGNRERRARRPFLAARGIRRYSERFLRLGDGPPRSARNRSIRGRFRERAHPELGHVGRQHRQRIPGRRPHLHDDRTGRRPRDSRGCAGRAVRGGRAICPHRGILPRLQEDRP